MPAECCKKFFEKMVTERPEEPVFTLRAADVFAPDLIHDWCYSLFQKMLRGEGGNAAKLQKGLDHLRAIRDWQKAHPNLVKIPD